MNLAIVLSSLSVTTYPRHPPPLYFSHTPPHNNTPQHTTTHHNIRPAVQCISHCCSISPHYTLVKLLYYYNSIITVVNAIVIQVTWQREVCKLASQCVDSQHCSCHSGVLLLCRTHARTHACRSYMTAVYSTLPRVCNRFALTFA